MRIVDIFGENVLLEDIEPWYSFVEHEGERSPIIEVRYKAGNVNITWQVQ